MGIKEFKDEIHFLEILLVIASILAVSSSITHPFVVFFILFSIVYYFVIDSGLYKKGSGGRFWYRIASELVTASFSAILALVVAQLIIPTTLIALIIDLMVAALYYVLFRKIIMYILTKPYPLRNPKNSVK